MPKKIKESNKNTENKGILYNKLKRIFTVKRIILYILVIFIIF